MNTTAEFGGYLTKYQSCTVLEGLCPFCWNELRLNYTYCQRCNHTYQITYSEEEAENN